MNEPPPYLSHSQIERYCRCPESYRLRYLVGLRPKTERAALVFGTLIHASLASHFRRGADPVAAFRESWALQTKEPLQYSGRDTAESLGRKGEALLELFVREELPSLGRPLKVESGFEVSISTLDRPFRGVLDLVVQNEDSRMIVDFKTSSGAMPSHEVALSDQLSAYFLAEPEATSAAFCVFLKTKEPRIEWQRRTRSAEPVLAFLEKARLVGEAISRFDFFRNPGDHCSWCEFLPVCLGDETTARETLRQVG